jgi:gas vesicle protein
MNKDDQEVESSNNTGNILSALGGLMVGCLAGAVTMLLVAPQSGKRTRLQIQQKGIELRDQTTEMLEDALTQAKRDSKKLARSGRQKVKELLDQGQVMVTEQLEQVNDAAKVGKKAILSFQG